MSTEFSDFLIERIESPPATADPEENVIVVISRVTGLAPTVTNPLCGSIAISLHAYNQFRAMGRQRGDFKKDEWQSEVICEMTGSFACAVPIGRDRHHRMRFYDEAEGLMYITSFRVLLEVIGVETVAHGVNGKKIPICTRAYDSFRDLCVERGLLSEKAEDPQIVGKLVELVANTARRLQADQFGNLVYTNWETKLRFIVDPNHYLILMVYDCSDERLS